MYLSRNGNTIYSVVGFHSFSPPVGKLVLLSII
jgi:hypothetical protein